MFKKNSVLKILIIYHKWGFENKINMTHFKLHLNLYFYFFLHRHFHPLVSLHAVVYAYKCNQVHLHTLLRNHHAIFLFFSLINEIIFRKKKNFFLLSFLFDRFSNIKRIYFPW